MSARSVLASVGVVVAGLAVACSDSSARSTPAKHQGKVVATVPTTTSTTTTTTAPPTTTPPPTEPPVTSPPATDPPAPLHSDPGLPLPATTPSTQPGGPIAISQPAQNEVPNPG